MLGVLSVSHVQSGSIEDTRVTRSPRQFQPWLPTNTFGRPHSPGRCRNDYKLLHPKEAIYRWVQAVDRRLQLEYLGVLHTDSSFCVHVCALL